MSMSNSRQSPMGVLAMAAVWLTLMAQRVLAHAQTTSATSGREHAISSRATGTQNTAWCLGSGTVMLNGFTTDTSTCVTYLFQGAALNTEAKFAVACVGTFFLSVAFQALYFFRDHIARGSRKRQKKERRAASIAELSLQSLLFGVSATVGYFIMLLTMTFSTYLFIMVVLGLTAGHFTCSVAVRNVDRPGQKETTSVVNTDDAPANSTGDVKAAADKARTAEGRMGAESGVVLDTVSGEGSGAQSMSEDDDESKRHVQSGEACCGD